MSYMKEYQEIMKEFEKTVKKCAELQTENNNLKKAIIALEKRIIDNQQ